MHINFTILIAFGMFLIFSFGFAWKIFIKGKGNPEITKQLDSHNGKIEKHEKKLTEIETHIPYIKDSLRRIEKAMNHRRKEYDK